MFNDAAQYLFNPIERYVHIFAFIHHNIICNGIECKYDMGLTNFLGNIRQDFIRNYNSVYILLTCYYFQSKKQFDE